MGRYGERNTALGELDELQRRIRILERVSGPAAGGSTGQAVSVRTTSHTLAPTDVSKMLIMSSSSALTIAVPTNASVSWPIGGRVDILAAGTGTVTLAAANPGVTTISTALTLVSRARWSVFSLMMYATDDWVAYGDLA